MSTLDPSSFTALLAAPALEPDARAALRRQALRALVPLAAVVALGGLWAAVAPLSGAIVAPAQIKVELNRKTVQHQEGGIVREILVRDGQQVRAGEPLLVVGDVRSSAELSLLQGLVRAERIRQARAAAEAALEPRFTVPADLASEAAEHLARERALFAARRRTLDEQIVSLQTQIREAQAQAAALETQIAATETSTRLADEELEINAKLARDGYVQRTRVLALQRGAADYRGKVGEYRSELAVARQRAAELDARIAQARNQYQSQAADELKEASARMRELEERLRPSQDQVERQLVRAPVDGEVMALRVAAAGEAVGPRQPLLDIVPARERLVIEGRIRPEEIDHVRKDAPAEVRLTAFDARSTPLLPGTVVFVSPDRVTRAETGESWFTAVVEVDAAALKDHPHVRLQAGMPAELYVTTPARSVVQYLAKPLGGFTSRGMREP
jgi:HlyD family type I secretion membrane fusion protein